MPPKKPQEKKEIQPLALDNKNNYPWWQFRTYSEDEIKKIDEFFVNYQAELLDHLKPTLKESLQSLSNQIGFPLHPGFNYLEQFSQIPLQTPLEIQLQENEVTQFSGQSPLNSQGNQEQALQAASAQQQVFQQSKQIPQSSQLSQKSQQASVQKQQPQTSSQQNGGQILNSSIVQSNQLEAQADPNNIQDQHLNLNQAKPKPNYIILGNIKIDYVSLKLLLYCFDNFPDLEVLKCSYNNFGQSEVKCLFEWASNSNNKKLIKFFWDWNPLPADISQSLIPKLGCSNIQFLILRSCQINDLCIKELCQQIIANQNANIQYLELFDNLITESGIKNIGELLKSYNKLQYLGLGKNNLTETNVLQPILSNIGSYVLTPEEVDQYKIKEKERDDLINDSKKKKKKINDSEIPKLFPLVEVKSGQFALDKNPQLKCLNLCLNPLGKNPDDSDFIIGFLQLQNEEFTLSLQFCKFNGKTIEKLKQKQKNKILI